MKTLRTLLFATAAVLLVAASANAGSNFNGNGNGNGNTATSTATPTATAAALAPPRETWRHCIPRGSRRGGLHRSSLTSKEFGDMR